MTENKTLPPLGVIHVDLGEGNRAEWTSLFVCPGCGKTLDLNTEVFGEYRKHNNSMGILKAELRCTACGTHDHAAYFVRATKFNGPVLEYTTKNGRVFICKPTDHQSGLRRVLSDWWFSITVALGLEKFR